MITRHDATPLLDRFLHFMKHLPKWKSEPIHNHEGEFCHNRVTCEKCGFKWGEVWFDRHGKR